MVDTMTSTEGYMDELTHINIITFSEFLCVITQIATTADIGECFLIQKTFYERFINYLYGLDETPIELSNLWNNIFVTFYIRSAPDLSMGRQILDFFSAGIPNTYEVIVLMYFWCCCLYIVYTDEAAQKREKVIQRHATKYTGKTRSEFDDEESQSLKEFEENEKKVEEFIERRGGKYGWVDFDLDLLREEDFADDEEESLSLVEFEKNERRVGEYIKLRHSEYSWSDFDRDLLRNYDF